jgi:hypothetical protein
MPTERDGATEAMARLGERRARAAARIEQLEKEAREAGRALTEARDALVDFERRGGRPAERTKLERTLAEAKARAAEPWQERVEGARHALRDVDAEQQRFAGEHLTELVETLEADGRIAATDLNAHAQGVLEAFQRRERIAAEISALASTVGPGPSRRRQPIRG